MRVFHLLLGLMLVGFQFSGCSFVPPASESTTDQRGPASLQRNTQRIAVGLHHACAITSSGGVKCWGRNDQGQLGNGRITKPQTRPQNVIGVDRGIIGIAAGENHTCVLTDDGGVKCWGGNEKGQLGTGTTVRVLVPQYVRDLLAGVVAIAAGKDHSCALLKDGSVKCWGANDFSQLGISTEEKCGMHPCRTLPETVAELGSGVREIFVSGNSSCAMQAGLLKCWGRNFSMTPGLSKGLAGMTHLALGDEASCGLFGEETRCWSSAESHSAKPVAVPIALGVRALASGGRHHCVLPANGGVLCWGFNGLGQLGNGRFGIGGNELYQTHPAKVRKAVGYPVAIAANLNNTCVLYESDRVSCWGDNHHGQTGHDLRTPLVPFAFTLTGF